MFVGLTGTFLKNGGQALLYKYTKKGDRNNTDNYRRISLLNTGYKINLKNNCKEINSNCRSFTIRRVINNSPRQEEVFRVHLLEDSSIKLFYQRRLEQNLTHSTCSRNINAEWQTLKKTLQQADIKVCHSALMLQLHVECVKFCSSRL